VSLRPYPTKPSERGAVAVEAALVIPLLLLLTFGIVDFGWMINRDTMLNTADREGAREGALNPSATDIESAVRAELDTLPAGDVTVNVTCRKVDDTACTNFGTDARPAAAWSS
jgi:Flp pilus assembly protein TadG